MGATGVLPRDRGRRIALWCVAALAAVAAAIAAAGAAPAGAARISSLYVAKGGSDEGNSCTSAEDPCATIDHALSVASPYEQISVGPGTFAEGLDLTQPVTIVGSGEGGGTKLEHPYQAPSPATVTVEDVTVTLAKLSIVESNDETSWGEGIRVEGGNLTLRESTISGEYGAYGINEGPASANSGPARVTVEDSTLDAPGTALNETGASSGYTVAVSDLTVIDSTIASPGGTAITNSASQVASFEDSVAESGQLTVTGSTIDDSNEGIYNEGKATILNTTVSGIRGDALYSYLGYHWGVDYALGDTPFEVIDSTIAGDRVGLAGTDGVFGLRNSLLAENSGGDCSMLFDREEIHSHGRVLADDDTCEEVEVVPNMHLGPLAPNGGPTETMALQTGSPAIGAQAQEECEEAPVYDLDQRGDARNARQRGRCDVGAWDSGGIGVPEQLVITSPPRSGYASTAPLVGPITVTEEDLDGTPIPAGEGGTTVGLNGYGATPYLSDTSGGPLTRSLTIPAGASSASFFYGAGGPGEWGVVVEAPDMLGSDQAVTVEEVPPGPAPTVTKLSANKGEAAGGTQVTISGSGFVGVDAVRFGSVPAAGFTVGSAGSITAIAPPGTTGSVNVTVTTKNGTSAASTKNVFKYGSPTVTAVSPSSGPRDGGTVVTVTGSGFSPGSATTFEFGKGDGTSVDCSSTTSCTVTSPAAAKAGAVDVRAKVGTKTSKKNAPADRFTYE